MIYRSSFSGNWAKKINIGQNILKKKWKGERREKGQGA